MWLNERCTAWKCMWKICNECVMHFCQHGPESHILWKSCHEVLLLFWDKKYNSVPNKGFSQCMWNEQNDREFLVVVLGYKIYLKLKHRPSLWQGIQQSQCAWSKKQILIVWEKGCRGRAKKSLPCWVKMPWRGVLRRKWTSMRVLLNLSSRDSGITLISSAYFSWTFLFIYWTAPFLFAPFRILVLLV